MPHKILIIDDDPFILDMYTIKFKEGDFQVETARDGKEGIRKIAPFQPELVLLDVVMPAMDGFQTLQELQEMKNRGEATFKIIFLTNFGQKDDVERGMQLGADDYIIKAHFTPSEVVQKVKTLLGS